MTHLLYPFLQQIGILWTTSKSIPAQEHFISNLIRQKLITAIDQLPRPSAIAPKILLFLLEGESHEIGLLLASFIAQERGWKVYYLGQNVPTDNVKMVTDAVQPDLMLSMFIVPAAEKMELKIASITNQIDIPFLISGNPVNVDQIDSTEKLIKIASPAHLSSILEDTEMLMLKS